ncbi:MAG: squalene--hopene cyclase [Acidobacteria bacterium]|nr:MAG: squalene--hopene cyclase [Acidobacteriota bacterium]
MTAGLIGKMRENPAREALNGAVRELQSALQPEGCWAGELASSALATATAACALELYRRAVVRRDGAPGRGESFRAALDWIAAHQNQDGGWGDTVDSPSNLSTTVLCWAALGLSPSPRHADCRRQVDAYLGRELGDLNPATVARGVVAAYGDDKTFSVPILTLCALTGRFGEGRDAWEGIPPIPFELAAIPHRWLRRLGLPMVSYAMPALIAMGQVGHFHRPTVNPITRILRGLARRRTLEILTAIQPRSGGFLEAAPLTSFVVMSLVGCGQDRHPVVDRGVRFLLDTVREDGSWPIDTNLNVWLTGLAVEALASGGRLSRHLPPASRRRILAWVKARQYLGEHPYTRAPAGGWAWTELSGGVPDGDDTPAALLVLGRLAERDSHGRVVDADLCRRAAAGAAWLLGLQNRDGGLPTFCRGWGRMPFDRSSPDLTAHALRAWDKWLEELPADLQRRLGHAADRARSYLVRTQRGDGAWTPLWFGNQAEPSLENPVYGTAKVLLAGHVRSGDRDELWQAALRRGTAWLVSCRNGDGGWGGGPGVSSSIEETGLAVEALAARREIRPSVDISGAIQHGVDWLRQATREGTSFPPTPIGLYFARLWYWERLYPVIFAVAGLERALSRKKQDID